jgi:membrane protease YdiL (CAAX protease family)
MLALAFAMTFPTVMAWAYFVALAAGGQPSRAQQVTYAAGKVVQFGFPLAFLALVVRRWPSWQAPGAGGMALGVGLGLVVGAALIAAYFGGLRNAKVLAGVPPRLRAKLVELGVDSLPGYVALTAFLALAHSLLEEYYWRWFVYGRLRTYLAMAPALVLASAAFAAHHVVVVWAYAPDRLLTGVLPAGLAVALAGAAWAWIYEKSGSLLGPWACHLLLDAALFVIGWDLAFRR